MKSRKSISQKQLVANQKNSKLAGVKSKAGKNITKLNAIKHGCLSCHILPYESPVFDEVKAQLEKEMEPRCLLQYLCIERIALHTIQLRRISFAVNEFLQAVEDPRVVESYLDVPIFDETVVNEGYQPQVLPADMEKLLQIYSRYETATENRLYRAIKEYKQLSN
ncbi:hypothetical protein QWY77_02790 [Thalassotalea ponticola]|uniref:hypothetical protein n=1 Tax=Thalassotalea ponticola TaxID=1523392 RepID=UPI0025B45F37|nr:hypothetical protein [Thalassotalea ponticola]MDN3651690.1 hypothetical protein [Thalassotalea ponticola]